MSLPPPFHPSQDVLPDVLQPHMRLVFCGTAVGHTSARRGAYYAHPQNRFWRTLEAVGLTPRLYLPEEFLLMPQLGIGFTDVAKAAQGMDVEITAHAWQSARLREALLHFQPDRVAFTSKKAAEMAYGVWFSEKKLSYGLLPQSLGKTRFWVLPSPSGAACKYWDIAPWQALADQVKAEKMPL